MTDIEARKAAALKAYNKWLSGVQHKICVSETDSEMFALYCHTETIRELLQPSPPVADGEVDAEPGSLLGNINHVRDHLLIGSKTTGLSPKSCEVLLRWIDVARDKAQQPRQEWMDIERAFKNGWVNGAMTGNTEGKLSGADTENDWQAYKIKVKK